MEPTDMRLITLRLHGDLKAEVEAFMERENRKPANAVEQLIARGLEYERQSNSEETNA